MTAHQAPSQSEKQKRQNCETKAEVPNHGIAAQLGRDKQTQHTEGQSPMEKAGGQIPDAKSDHGHFQRCKDEGIMESFR